MIFVTGGTGLLGNCIVRELRERGQAVRALCRAGTARDCFRDLDIDIVEGDLSDPNLLSTAAKDCEAVIHSAAMIHIGWQNLELARAVNVEGTRNIVKACQQNGAKLLHISTVDTLPAAQSLEAPISESVFENARDSTGDVGVPKTPCTYVVSKRESEDVVWEALREASDFQASVIHPGFMLAPFDWKPSSGRMMLEVHKAPILAAPPGGCSLCDARDVAAGIVNALSAGQRGERYILAGRNIPYQELWREMLQAMGRNKRVFKMGPLVRLAGHAIDFGIRTFGIKEGDINGAAIAMGSLNHYYDSSKAERDLDYQLRPAQETLSDAWKWLEQHHL